ncbi:MAG TPA: radical SAM protein [Candidatus Saccharimonadales bacterium]|nr:radical SAM protein [Candidatus Saccharimonadales bacterium]
MTGSAETWPGTEVEPPGLDWVAECSLADAEAWRQFLTNVGAIEDSAFGVQYDLNAAWRNIDSGEGEKVVGASLCDHNCIQPYACPAAVSLTKGILPSTLVPSDVMLGSIGTLEEGIEATRQDFFGTPFDEYCNNFQIPPAVAAAIRLALDKPGMQVNLFGGNPELNRGVTTVIRELRAAGHTVHLTTTGGRFMREPKFLAEIVENPPSLIALSADDFSGPEDVRELASLSLQELKTRWRKVPPSDGQRRKAHEAIYTAKLAAETAGFPPILFNMVLHGDNLACAGGIIDALTDRFPGVLVNPFPAQSAFSYDEEPVLGPEHAALLRDFIDQVLETQIQALRAGESTRPYVPRLHYWLMLRSVFDMAGDMPEMAMGMITGNHVWQCYRNSPAGFYAQVGLGPDGHVRSSGVQHPGGYLGCFWNKETVTDGSKQVWDKDMTSGAVKVYLQIGKGALAAASKHRCPGCAFPRLVGHIISAESGMDPRLLPFYLDRRKEALGF